MMNVINLLKCKLAFMILSYLVFWGWSFGNSPL
jgi:hypothetical protein